MTRPSTADIVSAARTLLDALRRQPNPTGDVTEARNQLGQLVDRYDRARPLVCCRYWRTSGGQTHNADCRELQGDGRWPLTVPYEQAAQLVNQQRARTLNPGGRP